MTISAPHLDKQEDFDQLMVDLYQIASQRKAKIEYDIKLSDVHYCDTCGNVTSMRNFALGL